jgi:hypothetical protein
MRRWWVVAILALAVSGLVTTPGEAQQAEGAGGAPALADLEVTGTGVSTYPAFGPSVRRFGIRTTAETAGVTVTATTESPDDLLTIAGQPATSGQGRTFRGLKPGDGITIRVGNGGGERVYDVVYLPPSFPVVNVTTRRAGIAPGFLFLGTFIGPPFNIVMDNAGVPVYVNRRVEPPFDFKPQPGGRYTFLERSGQQTSTGRDIFDAVVLNSSMEEIRRRRTAPPLTNTDNHEVLLLPDGHRILMAYEPVEHDGTVREDTVVQEVDAAGDVVLEWSSWGDVPLADNLSGNLVDYAHGNSVDVDDDGNLLISLRGVSAVVKVNRTTGRLMWTLGGNSNDFDVDDPLGGFCGQHHAQRLDNGNLLIFDNGADCAPNGADRGVSRAVEYELDEVHHTAEMVWSHSQGIYGFATGSVQRLDNGNTLIGWGTAAQATEVSADDEVLWDATLRTSATNANSSTYRITRNPFPDHLRPRVAMRTPAAGATYLQGDDVRAQYFCADEGGASLATCDGSVRNGALLDTDTPGEHTVEVTATDGAGNTRTLTRTYSVVPNQPDLAVRHYPDGRLVGNDVYNRNGERQTRNANLRQFNAAAFYVNVQNDGTSEDDFLIHGTRHTNLWSVRYFDGSRDVTAAVKAGSYRIRDLAPHAVRRLQVSVGTHARTPRGASIDVYLQGRSTTSPDRRDTVRMAVRRVGPDRPLPPGRHDPPL